MKKTEKLSQEQILQNRKDKKESLEKFKAEQKILSDIVGKHFKDNVSLDDTAIELVNAGVKFSEIKNTIDDFGEKNGWILSPETLKKKVENYLDDKTISHFLDVLELSKGLDLPQLSESEKQKAIIDFSGVAKSLVAPSKKFKQFNNSGHMGAIANWVRNNPNFSHSELLGSGLIADAPHRLEYFEEFLAYQNFFENLKSA